MPVDKSIDKENTNGIGGSYTSYSLNSNNISTSSSSTITSTSLNSKNNASVINAVKLPAFNTTSSSSSTSKSSSSLTALSLLSLPSHTTKLFKKMNLFLWSPMSLLSSSSTSSKRAISKKSSLALKQQQKQSSSSSMSSNSSILKDLNNTLITSSTSSSTTTTTITTTSTSTIKTKTSTPSSTVASDSSSSRFTAKISSTELIQKTKQSKNKNNNNNSDKLSSQQPPLYIITPTYRRPEQLAELTRLGYTLKHVVNLLWLVIEDANRTSDNVIQILNRIGVPYEYFLAPMPDEYKKAKAKPRGVSNRNRGLQWLRENATEGVFYFADDDNTYDINIFEQMRYTKKVSMWPVGLVTKFGVSSPIVKAGKLTGFYDGWIGGRKYPVDMAGFAVSVKFLHDRPNAKMPFKTGYEEDGFLKSLAPLNNTEIELLASNCTEILTWHTQTKKNNPAEIVNATKYGDTNLMLLEKMLVRH
ncbi:Galactosylgalactosylxylosylprotein 3-beta-glucuronosyltransferase P [Lucilia cuprina]|uniref:Galactosylgalactosylxylosylprotein 3-beta-glucuronosyltransferase n=1 Tax=Lucilia cuprina TaxID=7375 RepID=A0A0L0C0C7_LUCCU|nr:Galactosylgalactosylxylosylprotein 3-beta-glucuronosyltransferase P [Lucilia cuprina]